MSDVLNNGPEVLVEVAAVRVAAERDVTRPHRAGRSSPSGSSLRSPGRQQAAVRELTLGRGSLLFILLPPSPSPPCPLFTLILRAGG